MRIRLLEASGLSDLGTALAFGTAFIDEQRRELTQLLRPGRVCLWTLCSPSAEITSWRVTSNHSAYHSMHSMYPMNMTLVSFFRIPHL